MGVNVAKQSPRLESSEKPRTNRRLPHKPTWLWPAVIILICAAYVSALLIFRDLRNTLFIQRLTGPILTTFVAIALFTAVPSTARVKYPVLQRGLVLLSGGAAFYLLALPLINNVLFPSNITVDGYIYLKNSDGSQLGRTPVQGVVIQIPETGQQSAPTDAQGRFIITHVSFTPRKLNAQYGGQVYEFDTDEFKDKTYPVIPAPSQISTTSPQFLDSSEWKSVVSRGCNPRSAKKRRCQFEEDTAYFEMANYVLEKVVPTMPGYEKLYVRIRLPKEVDIVDAQKIIPGSEVGYEVDDPAGYCQTRKWWVPLTGDSVKLRISICLAAKKSSRGLSVGDIETSFYFAKA